MSIFNKILVPTDFSAKAEEALKVAITVAETTQSEIILLHVLEVPKTLKESNFKGPDSLLSYLSEVKKDGEDNLNKLIEKHQNDQVKIVGKAIKGYVEDEITNYQKQEQVPLIVMGTNGIGGMEDFLLGSNTEKVVRLATCPVLTVDGEMSLQSFKDLMFVSDFKEDVTKGFAPIKEFAELFGSTVHLVRINTPNYFENTLFAEGLMHEFAKTQNLKDYTVTQFDYRNFEAGVIKCALHKKVNMLIMGTHGRKGLSRLIRGSVTEDVVNHINFPVLTFKI